MHNSYCMWTSPAIPGHSYTTVSAAKDWQLKSQVFYIRIFYNATHVPICGISQANSFTERALQIWLLSLKWATSRTHCASHMHYIWPLSVHWNSLLCQVYLLESRESLYFFPWSTTAIFRRKINFLVCRVIRWKIMSAPSGSNGAC